MTTPFAVKIGFVPSFRFRFTPWCQKMRDDSLTAFARVKGMEIVVPQPSPDGKTLDAAKGLTPHGTVSTLDEAEVVAEYFRSQPLSTEQQAAFEASTAQSLQQQAELEAHEDGDFDSFAAAYQASILALAV